MNSMHEFRIRLGKIIRESRVNKKWQQEQLALAVGLKRTSISNIEAGRQSISLELYCSICEQLGINASANLDKLLDKADNTTLDLESIKNPAIKKHILSTLN